MDQPQPTAELTPSQPAGDTPTLLDLAIDQSWGATDVAAAPPVTSHEVGVDGVHERPHWSIAGWFQRRKEQQALAQTVDELGDETTETIDLTPDPFWKTALKTGGAFIGSAALAYLILTFPSQWVKVTYAVEHFGKKEGPATIVTSSAASGGNFQDVVVPSLSFRPPTAASSTGSSTTNQPGSSFATLADNQLTIPKINVTAPVIWDSSFDEKIMLENLQKGVVHYGGTDLPNPSTGNVFITGHSSYYWWDPGTFKTIFALLDQLKSGDQVALTYQKEVFVYQVYESIVVKPTQTDVLDTTEKPILSLMTCTPVGTSINRLIVRANLIGVFAQGEATPATPADTSGASSNPAAPATAPTAATPTPQSTGTPSEGLDLLPGLDSWIGR